MHPSRARPANAANNIAAEFQRMAINGDIPHHTPHLSTGAPVNPSASLLGRQVTAAAATRGIAQHGVTSAGSEHHSRQQGITHKRPISRVVTLFPSASGRTRRHKTDGRATLAKTSRHSVLSVTTHVRPLLTCP